MCHPRAIDVVPDAALVLQTHHIRLGWSAQALQLIATTQRRLSHARLQVLDGAVTPGSAMRLPIGGAMLDSILKRELKKRDVTLKESNWTTLKEKCAAVAESAVAFQDMRAGENAMESSTEVELPDGQKVSIGTEGCVT